MWDLPSQYKPGLALPGGGKAQAWGSSTPVQKQAVQGKESCEAFPDEG